MSRIKKYDHFLILEKFDDNIIAELKRLGVTDKDEINRHLYHAHRGNLGENNNLESYKLISISNIFC